MMSLQFSIDGTPVPKGRARFRKIGKFVSTYTPAKTKTYEDLVREAARKAMGDMEPLETPVSAYLYFRLPIPKSYSKKRSKDCLSGLEQHVKKPDIDNIVKSVLDGLNGIVFLDDCQIVSLHCKKLYASEPGVDLYITEHLL